MGFQPNDFKNANFHSMKGFLIQKFNARKVGHTPNILYVEFTRCIESEKLDDLVQQLQSEYGLQHRKLVVIPEAFVT